MPNMSRGFLALGTFLSLVVFIISIVTHHYLMDDRNGCQMTFSMKDKSSIPLKSDVGSWPYSLYLYGSLPTSKLDLTSFDIKTTPVLFIPGSLGHVDQARSLSSFMHNNDEAFTFFSIDFLEEASVLETSTVISQAMYVNECILRISDIFRRAALKQGVEKEFEVMIVAHSMGGIVARTAFMLPNHPSNCIVKDMILLASPNTRSPFGVDTSMESLFNNVNHQWKMSFYRNCSNENLKNHHSIWKCPHCAPYVRIVSITGGMLDSKILPEQTLLKDITPLPLRRAPSQAPSKTSPLLRLLSPLLSIVSPHQWMMFLMSTLTPVFDLYSYLVSRPDNLNATQHQNLTSDGSVDGNRYNVSLKQAEKDHVDDAIHSTEGVNGHINDSIDASPELRYLMQIDDIHWNEEVQPYFEAFHLSMFASALPLIASSVDHEAILWCHQLLQSLLSGMRTLRHLPRHWSSNQFSSHVFDSNHSIYNSMKQLQSFKLPKKKEDVANALSAMTTVDQQLAFFYRHVFEFSWKSPVVSLDSNGSSLDYDLFAPPVQRYLIRNESDRQWEFQRREDILHNLVFLKQYFGASHDGESSSSTATGIWSNLSTLFSSFAGIVALLGVQFLSSHWLLVLVTFVMWILIDCQTFWEFRFFMPDEVNPRVGDLWKEVEEAEMKIFNHSMKKPSDNSSASKKVSFKRVPWSVYTRCLIYRHSTSSLSSSFVFPTSWVVSFCVHIYHSLTTALASNLPRFASMDVVVGVSVVAMIGCLAMLSSMSTFMDFNSWSSTVFWKLFPWMSTLMSWILAMFISWTLRLVIMIVLEMWTVFLSSFLALIFPISYPKNAMPNCSCSGGSSPRLVDSMKRKTAWAVACKLTLIALVAMVLVLWSLPRLELIHATKNASSEQWTSKIIQGLAWLAFHPQRSVLGATICQYSKSYVTKSMATSICSSLMAKGNTTEVYLPVGIYLHSIGIVLLASCLCWFVIQTLFWCPCRLTWAEIHVFRRYLKKSKLLGSRVSSSHDKNQKETKNVATDLDNDEQEDPNDAENGNNNNNDKDRDDVQSMFNRFPSVQKSYILRCWGMIYGMFLMLSFPHVCFAWRCLFDSFSSPQVVNLLVSFGPDRINMIIMMMVVLLHLIVGLSMSPLEFFEMSQFQTVHDAILWCLSGSSWEGFVGELDADMKLSSLHSSSATLGSNSTCGSMEPCCHEDGGIHAQFVQIESSENISITSHICLGPTYQVISCDCSKDPSLKEVSSWCEWCRCLSCGGKGKPGQDSRYGDYRLFLNREQAIKNHLEKQQRSLHQQLQGGGEEGGLAHLVVGNPGLWQLLTSLVLHTRGIVLVGLGIFLASDRLYRILYLIALYATLPIIYITLGYYESFIAYLRPKSPSK